MKISLAKIAALAKPSHPVCLGRGTAGRELRTGHMIICHCVWRALKARGISTLDVAAVQAAIGAEEETVAPAEKVESGVEVTA